MNASPLPHIVLVTGAIGSGKSRLCAAFAELGVPCLDTDGVARQIHQDSAHPATLALAQAFPQAMTADGRLARGSLRNVFAADRQANLRLKQILGPAVLAEVARWTAVQAAPYVIIESALVTDVPGLAERVLVADAPDALRLERIASRNPDWPQAHTEALLALQVPRAQYLASADDVIVNDGILAALARRALEQHRHYLTLWSST